uniref:NTR domain-containing protein n=1 Tax=Panagrolaimus davidi TaxID=227884 RepID=A0A914QFH3_9BILA
MVKLFVAVFLFAFILSTSEACSCTPENPQRSLQIYCSADLVAEIKVFDTQPFGGNFYEFSINYTTVYKMPTKFNETYPFKIYTNQQSSACGMKLSHNLDIIVVGNINEYNTFGPKGEIGIAMCSYLDAEFKESLKNGTFIDCSELKNV